MGIPEPPARDESFATFGFLYLLIYFLLRAEDNALLVGAIASFIAVAASMYFTRRIDWYSPLGATEAAGQRETPAPPKGTA